MSKEIKKSKTSLFSLVAISQEIKQDLIENEGELTESLEDRLTSNTEQLEEKATAYAFTINDIKKDIELLKDMEKQIRERKKKLEGAITRIKGALLTGLNICNIKTIESGAYRITVGKKKDTVSYTEDLIPEDYFINTVSLTEGKEVSYLDLQEIESFLLEKGYSFSLSKKLDKASILDQLKEGVTIPGAELIQDTEGNQQLYIK